MSSDAATRIGELWQLLAEDPGKARQPEVDEIVRKIDAGELRTAERQDDRWHVAVWVKQALDIYFKTQAVASASYGAFSIRDRFPLKAGAQDWNFRLAPIGTVRYGAHVAAGATIMPAHVNLGAYIGANSVVDTWVSIGTCSQICDRVTLLPGTSIIGSLAPIDLLPAIVEDDCYIGSNCVVGSSVRVREGAVLESGTVITANTPIVNLTAAGSPVSYADVPEHAVVVPGVQPAGASGAAISAALVIGSRAAGEKAGAAVARALAELTAVS
jgi:2,3,4,5-tetrahydropyridine-2,6-dicarboxylate N-succinyltransferase